jgi:hypothetical protein
MSFGEVGLVWRVRPSEVLCLRRAGRINRGGDVHQPT